MRFARGRETPAKKRPKTSDFVRSASDFVAQKSDVFGQKATKPDVSGKQADFASENVRFSKSSSKTRGKAFAERAGCESRVRRRFAIVTTKAPRHQGTKAQRRFFLWSRPGGRRGFPFHLSPFTPKVPRPARPSLGGRKTFFRWYRGSSDWRAAPPGAYSTRLVG